MGDRPTEPDYFAFWRGLVTGLCLAGCIWIALIGGVWALLFNAV